MPSFSVSVAAASATIGTDLFLNEPWARSPQNRTLDAVGIKGSAAALDTEVEVFIDEQRIGNFFNTNTGFPNFDDMVDMRSAFVPAGALLRCLVRDAPATNPINVRVDITNR